MLRRFVWALGALLFVVGVLVPVASGAQSGGSVPAVQETYTETVVVGYERVRVAPYTEQVRVAPYTEQVRVAPYTETVRVAPYTEQVRVAPYTETVRVAPYTETVRVAPCTETVRVAPYTETVRVAPYTETVRVAPFTGRVRVAPYTETVRVAPYSETITGTYDRTETYCARWDVVVGQSVCVEWATRVVTVTYTEVVEAFNYETRDVYNYETVDAYNYETRDVYNYETVDAYNYETRDVYNYETVDAYNYEDRPVYNYEDRPVYNYEDRPVYNWGIEDVYNYEDRAIYGHVERTRWVCPSGYGLNDATDPPLCDPDSTTTTPPVGACVAVLGVLGSGTVTESGTWDSGCISDHQGSAQVPYYARRYSFSVDAAAAVTVGVSSSQDAYVYLADSAGSVLAEDDDSGAGADALIDGYSLSAGDYVIEVSTAAPRVVGAFSLSVTVAGTVPPPVPVDVVISGFADASGTPAPGGATATVSDQIEVSPPEAVCSAGPLGATVSPERDAAARAVSMEVAAGTTVEVTVECSRGTARDTARAQFTADVPPPVPVDVVISGFADVFATPEPGAASVTVAGEFTVSPASAACSAYSALGTPVVTPATGTPTRSVSLVVAEGTSEYVVAVCETDGDRDVDVAQFTAHAAPTGPQPPGPPGCPADGGETRSTRSVPGRRTTDSCPAPPVDACSEALSPGEPGRDSDSGTIAEDLACTSSLRSSSTSVYYARRYSFSLDAPGWVTVDLLSDPSEMQRLDTYLVLTGAGLDRPLRNDDARDPNGYHYDSRIGPQLLPAGTYVAEATTYGIGDTGSYTLDVEVTATGLAATHAATVGAPDTISFDYWPADARVAVQAAAAEEFGLAVSTARRSGYGTATITLTPQLVGDHQLTVRIASSDGTRQRLLDIELTTDCPAAPVLPGGPSLVASPHNAVLCIRAGTSGDAPAVGLYEVTPGTLNGTRASAAAVLAARADRLQCGLTVNKLAAFMLSIGFREVPFPSLVNLQPDPARSPMTLSRADTDSNPILSTTQQTRNRRLYSDNNPNASVGPRRAFFHPGVGLWQLDDGGGTMPWVSLNHGQRADTGLGSDGEYDSENVDSGGEVVAGLLAEQYCAGSDDEDKLGRVETIMDQQWGACSSGCISEQFAHIYLDGSHDLYVTVAENVGEYGISGGVSAHRCRWSDDRVADPIACFFYDTSRPEGRMHDGTPSANLSWRSPLAAPFVAFTDDQTRFAVFPDSILDSLSGASDAVISTRFKAVPQTANVRLQDYDWQTEDYGGAVLEVEICGEREWSYADESDRVCAWAGVNEAGFANAVGVGG